MRLSATACFAAVSLSSMHIASVASAGWAWSGGSIALTSTLRQGGYPYNGAAYNQDASGSLNAGNQWSGQVICYGYSTQRGNQTAAWSQDGFSLQAETFHNGGSAQTAAVGQLSFAVSGDSTLTVRWDTNELNGWWGNNGVYNSQISISRAADGVMVWAGAFSGTYAGADHGATLTESVALYANTNYIMSINHTTSSGASPYSPSRCDLTMSLSPLPAPSAAPLLALAGLTARGRRRR
jgi:hypothetical protein